MKVKAYTRLYVSPGCIIQFDDQIGVRYKVISCIDLILFGKEGYQMNLMRL